jgi:acyl-coenzyme A thioesterase PaaI-like protein
MTVTSATGDDDLATHIAARFNEGGAPLMQEMNLRIDEAEPGRVRFTLPVVERLTHGGGVLCGQAIMACMDTGMVFVMMSLSDTLQTNFTTVELKTSFERGVPADVGDAVFEARASKPGRTLVFGEVDLLLPDQRRAAHGTATFVWLPDVTG